MGIVFRQSVKTSIVVLGGAVLGLVVLWLSTRYIDKQSYGFTRNLAGNSVVLSQILLLGMSSTLFVFSHRFPEDDKKRKVLLTICLSVPLAAIVLFSVVYLLFEEWILGHFQAGDQPLMRAYFGWLPLYILFMAYMVILEQYLGGQLKVALPAFVREVVLRLINIALVILFAMGYISFSFFVGATVLMYLLPVAVFLFICRGTKGFGFALDFDVFSRAEYREMLQFTWYHLLLSISIILLSSLDLNLLPFYDHKGFNSSAVYGVAINIISFLQIPSKAFLPASFSVLTRAFSENDTEKAKDIFVRSSVNMLIPTMAIAALICCNLHNAVAVIGTSKNYSDMIPVALILMAGQLVNIATGMNDQVLSITNYYKFTFYCSLAVTALLFILLRYSIPVYGIYGAAGSTAVTMAIFNLAKLAFVKSKLDMLPFSKSTTLIVLASLPALAAGYFLPHFFSPVRHIYVNAFLDTCVRSLVILVVYFLMLLWLKPSADLEEYLAQVKKNKRLF